jgi:tetratricopeptide (TPR) repeat protein
MDVFVKINDAAPPPKKEDPISTAKSVDPRLDPKNIQKFIMDTHQDAVKSFESKYYRKSLECFNILLKLNVDVHGCLLNIGTIYMITEKFSLAVENLKKAIEVEKSDWSQYAKLGESYIGLKKYAEAKKTFETGLLYANDDKAIISNLQTWIAKCHFKLNELNQAISVISPILEKEGRNPAALELYAEILFSQNIPEDVLPILLNVVTTNKSDRVKIMLTDVIQKHGVSKLLKLLGDQANTQILSFIATTVKEFGAIQECIELYELCCSKADMTNSSSASVSYYLNLAHVIELTLDYPKAIEVVMRVLQKYPKATLGGLTAVNVHRLYTNGEIDTIAYKVPSKYGSDDLNFLALLFTLVKITYLTGNLILVDKLIKILLPLQIEDLHLTLIRNENAYFSEITELSNIRRSKMVEENTQREMLYICGDSHCLSPAWNTITWNGKAQNLVPRLVTGLKCWHLRPESRFYPKVNFSNAISMIPKGSNIVMMFGEIDTREGILLAVEKLKYENVEEGVAFVIDIYLSVLNDLKSKFNLIIHPVLPVLDVTRGMVIIFNRILKEKCAKNGLRYLDFADELLENGKLKKQYELDGTHIHPSYLTVFEAYLNK